MAKHYCDECGELIAPDCVCFLSDAELCPDCYDVLRGNDLDDADWRDIKGDRDYHEAKEEGRL